MSEDASADHVLALVEERTDELVARIMDGIASFYTDASDEPAVPPDEMAANASVMARGAIVALREQRPPTDDEIAFATAVGERRARQGLALEDVLRGLRVGAREALVIFQDTAVEAGLVGRETIRLTTQLWDWVDAISNVVAGAHRSVELARARSDEQQRAALVHGLVRGTLDPRAAATRATGFGLDPAADHVVLVAYPEDAAAFERALLPRAWSPGVVAEVDGAVVAVLRAAPESAPDVAIGVGSALPLAGLARSYTEAVRAAAAAAAFGRTGVHRLGDLAFPALVLADESLGELIAQRYLEPARALGSFGDELLHSLRVYIAHDQNVDAAARELHVHPNTLRHRLSRYEETVGTSLRRVESLAEVWWALTYADRQQVDGAGLPAKRSAR